MRTRYILAALASIPILYAMLYWVVSVLIATLRGRNRQCPRCGCTRTRWSLIKLPERLFFPAFVLPRRCESCLNRYYSAVSVNYVRKAHAAAVAAAASTHASRPLPELITAALNGEQWLSRN